MSLRGNASTTLGRVQALLDWYAGAARDLPWRRPDATPWGVLVSEVMLQQTPVIRVLPAYRLWIQQWPTPAGLAAATPGDARSEEHTSELQSRPHLVCRLLLEKKKKKMNASKKKKRQKRTPIAAAKVQ